MSEENDSAGVSGGAENNDIDDSISEESGSEESGIGGDGGILGVSYWQSLGRDEDYAIEMMKFQDRLACYTKLLKLLKEYENGKEEALEEFERAGRGFFDDDWYPFGPSLRLEFSPIDWGVCVMRGDDILCCPQWQRFCQALQVCPDFVDEISLCSIGLTRALIDGLGPALESTVVLNFEEFALGGQEMNAIAPYLQGNSSLVSMRLMLRGDEELNDLEAAKQFFDVLKDIPSFHEFCFSASFNNHPEVLSIIMDRLKDLARIRTCWLRCPTEGHRISRVLAENPGMKHLMAGCSSFNGDDAIEFAKALAFNTNLKQFIVSMDVDDTRGDDSTEVKKKAGADALLKAVYDPSNLNVLLDCNHTCAVEYGGMGSLQKELNGLIKANWTRERIVKYKLLEALGAHSKEGLKVERLNDISLELMPRVLHLFQADHYQHNSFTSAFRTFRDRVAPVLSACSEG